MQHYISRNFDIPTNNSQEVNAQQENSNLPIGGLFGGDSLQIQINGDSIEHMN